MNDQEHTTYVKMTSYCKCGCKQHCGHSCLDCDGCTECDCLACQEQEQGKGYN